VRDAEEAQKRAAAEDARMRAEQNAKELERRKLERFRENRRKAAEAKNSGSHSAPPVGTASKKVPTPAATTPAQAAPSAPAKTAVQNAEQKVVAPERPVELVVKTAAGEEFVIETLLSASVKMLKEKIATARGCAVELQAITFAGRMLEDAKSLAESGVDENKAVFLVVRTASAAAPAAAASFPAAVAATSAASATASGVPSGSVLHLENGGEQLQAVLSACGAARACVVDYSAPWCGPCRAIAPEFAALARAHPSVSFVHVDTEASSANAALARTAGIRAYPTFHVYRNFAILDAFSGANPVRLRSIAQLYSQHAAPSAPASVATASSNAAAHPNASASASDAPGLSQRVMVALRALKSECRSDAEFVDAVRVLLTFVRNVEQHPHEPKYRRVRESNALYRSRLGSKPAGAACMRAFGFEERSEQPSGAANPERFLVLPDAAAHDPALGTVRAQLEAAVGAVSATPAASVHFTPSPSPPPPPSTLESMDSNGIDPSAVDRVIADPQFAAVMNEVMAQPEAMQQLMEAQEAMDSGDSAAIERLRDNATFTRFAESILATSTADNILRGGTGVPSDSELAAAAASAAESTTHSASPEEAEEDDEEERMLQEALKLSLEEHNEQKKERKDAGDGDDNGHSADHGGNTGSANTSTSPDGTS